MKKELSPGVVAAALVVVLAVIGLVAWRLFGPEPPLRATPEARAEAQRWAEAFKSQKPPGQPGGSPGIGGLPMRAPSSDSR